MDEDITRLLQDLSAGDREAGEKLLPLVYDDLRRLAGWLMARERGDHTLQPTALVNELYLRIGTLKDTDWKSREHFFSVAVRLMKHLLIDAARKKKAERHGGHLYRLPFDDHMVSSLFQEERYDTVIALDTAIENLRRKNAEAAQVVDLHFYLGMSFDEIAEVLGKTSKTAKRKWNFARAWLLVNLEGAEGEPTATGA
jgi:RNA polymerase sigma factor (TIGR02999 family)